MSIFTRYLAFSPLGNYLVDFQQPSMYRMYCVVDLFLVLQTDCDRQLHFIHRTFSTR